MRVPDDLDALEALVESQVATHLMEHQAATTGNRVERERLDDLGLTQDRYMLRIVREMRRDRQQRAASVLAEEPTLYSVQRRASRQMAEVSA